MEQNNKMDELNALTGDNNVLFDRLKSSIHNANQIDIIVSFLMESGVKLIIEDLKNAIEKGVKIRILTGNYLNITQPHALYLLRKELGDEIDLRFYNVPKKSFHPKAYIFHSDSNSEIYIGSSNLSKGALTDSIEWNYHFKKSDNEKDFNHFFNTFEELFYNSAIEVNDDVLREYSKSWVKPKFTNRTFKIETEDIEPDEINEPPEIEIFEPRGAQIEALYALDRSRNDGYDKGLVVAATGIGKTYLAAFDCENYDKVLFVAHREEIIKQARKSFKNVYPNKKTGLFYNKYKDTDADFIFALVQTLGKDIYLNDNYFEKDYFDYIVIDEFHHAVANNYKKIIEYFRPKFLLGLTATPERLDNKDVFALCDYNNVYEIRLKEAIAKGWLVPFRYYGIFDDTIDYSTVNMRNGRYDEKDLEEKLMIHHRAELIYRHYMKYPSKSAMGFCSSRNHAEFMANYFNEHGIHSVAVYSGEQGENTGERDEAIRKLKNGDLRVIFSVDMFNEGLDVPSIDTVLFLRPTQSPTIFLQQLGRGLRKYENKKYLTILDFIGNYKKANLIPFLLSEQTYDRKTLLNDTVLEFEYPDDCFIDFDFQLIDLFKIQAQNELKIKDKITIEYDIVKGDLEHRPSRVELFLGMDDDVINAMKRNSKYNFFKDYISFLDDNQELTNEEESIINTPAHDFLKILENTNMTKSYKMPILKAFYNNGNIKMNITDDDVYQSMKEFYNYGTNGADMLKDKSSQDYKTWTKREYLSLARRNPIKFLKRSSEGFFIDKEGYELSLCDELEKYIQLDSFKEHFKDIIEYKTMYYYKNKFEKNQ